MTVALNDFVWMTMFFEVCWKQSVMGATPVSCDNFVVPCYVMKEISTVLVIDFQLVMVGRCFYNLSMWDSMSGYRNLCMELVGFPSQEPFSVVRLFSVRGSCRYPWSFFDFCNLESVVSGLVYVLHWSSLLTAFGYQP